MNKNLKMILPLFLFSLYPSIALLGENYSVIGIEEAMRSVFVSILLSVTLLVVFNFLYKDLGKSSLVSLLFQFLFFNYGHIYDLLKKNEDIITINLGRHRYLGPLWTIIFVLGFVWIWRYKKDLLNITNTLSITFVVSLLFPIYNMLVYDFNHKNIIQDNLRVENSLIHEYDGSNSALPDIYYIVLDEYGRDDALLEIFDYDNTPFLDELENKNFTIAYCSQSNYARTSLSIASALNMNYIDQFFDIDLIENKDTEIEDLISENIKQSLVRAKFEELEYQTIAFETGFSFSEIKDADYYFYPAEDEKQIHPFVGKINHFESLLLNSTFIRFFINSVQPVAKVLVPLLEFPNQVDRARTLWILEKLETIHEIKGPKFVFAHIISPHEPFVFSVDGGYPVPEPDYFPGYPDQIQYLNQRIFNLIEIIQNNSEIQPIIIIQGDHSFRIVTDLKWRMAVLNAYYFPEILEVDIEIYSSITPVNSFRFIFNEYFGAAYEYLEDIAYFSDFENPEKFTEVPLERKCD